MKITAGITRVELTDDEIEIIRKAGKIFADIYDNEQVSVDCCQLLSIENASFKAYEVDELASTLLSIVE